MTTTEERFWSKVDTTSTPDGCWEWAAARLPRGYGEFFFSGHLRRAHRVAWIMANGPIPDGLWVLHRCDNPPCVRLDHLFLGTAQDNTTDMWTKGRGVAHHDPHPINGERHHMTTLTEEQVRSIRLRRGNGERGRALAKEYGVAEATVSMIVNRKTWVHVA